jgi:hypothetical protein
MLFCAEATAREEYSYMEIMVITREAAFNGTVWQMRKGRGIQKLNDYFSFTKIDSRQCPCIISSFLYSFPSGLIAGC